jgi:hypothetical protein
MYTKTNQLQHSLESGNDKKVTRWTFCESIKVWKETWDSIKSAVVCLEKWISRKSYGWDLPHMLCTYIV